MKVRNRFHRWTILAWVCPCQFDPPQNVGMTCLLQRYSSRAKENREHARRELIGSSQVEQLVPIVQRSKFDWHFPFKHVANVTRPAGRNPVYQTLGMCSEPIARSPTSITLQVSYSDVQAPQVKISNIGHPSSISKDET